MNIIQLQYYLLQLLHNYISIALSKQIDLQNHRSTYVQSCPTVSAAYAPRMISTYSQNIYHIYIEHTDTSIHYNTLTPTLSWYMQLVFNIPNEEGIE